MGWPSSRHRQNAAFAPSRSQVMLGLDVSKDNLPGLDSPLRPTRFVGIKSPMFSFTRLRGADPILGVEMASTGEVACFGENKHEAFLKALLASNFELPKTAILLSAQADYLPELMHAAFKLHRLGFKLYATPETAAFLSERGVPNEVREAAAADRSPSMLALIPTSS